LSKEGIDVRILFATSKALDPKSREVTFDKYKISSIPTARESLTDTSERVLLEFYDLWKNNQMSSNPEKEADYILSLLSLMLQMKVEFDSIMVNNVQATLKKKRSSFLRGKIEFPSDFQDLYKKLHSLDLDVLRQFLRSCSTYRTALSLIDDNPTLSFFLLVTAIEAVSNKVIKGDKIRENFTEFILKYLPSSFEEKLGNRKLLLSLIKEAYNMRNAFTHGGTEISVGTLSADNLKRDYVKHFIEGKETFSPSLRWFESVVHAVLLAFLRAQKIVDGKESKLPDLALEEAIIHVKAKRAIKAGRVVTTKDIDLNFRRG